MEQIKTKTQLHMKCSLDREFPKLPPLTASGRPPDTDEGIPTQYPQPVRLTSSGEFSGADEVHPMDRLPQLAPPDCGPEDDETEEAQGEASSLLTSLTSSDELSGVDRRSTPDHPLLAPPDGELADDEALEPLTRNLDVNNHHIVHVTHSKTIAPNEMTPIQCPLLAHPDSDPEDDESEEPHNQHTVLTSSVRSTGVDEEPTLHHLVLTPPDSELVGGEAGATHNVHVYVKSHHFKHIIHSSTTIAPINNSKHSLTTLRLLLIAGDIEQNPGPTQAQTWTCDICNRNITNRQISIRCNSNTTHWIHKKCTNITLQQYTNNWKCHRHTNPTRNIPTRTMPTTAPQPTPNRTTPQSPNTTHNKQLNIIQININGLHNKIDELAILAKAHKTDIITIQETKLTPKHKTPSLKEYTHIRTDRTHKIGGGLITYIHKNVTYTPLKVPQHINTRKTELQVIKIHLTNHKHLHITNMYIPPRDTTNADHPTEDEDITNTYTYLNTLENTITTGDLNAHSTQWFSPTNDHRGTLIADIIQNSQHLTLNTNTPTRKPPHADQQPTSPDITTATNNIANKVTWKTTQALNSDHLPIIITYNTKINFRIQQQLRTYTNYNKADWEEFTKEIEDTLTDIDIPNNIHTANRILTNIILSADKHNIPRGKINNKQKLLPENIRQLINSRNHIRQIDHKDPQLTDINREIDKNIQQHKTELWKQHLTDNWDHKTNTHKLWNTIAGLSNKKPTQSPNTTIVFQHKTAITNKQKAHEFNKQFTNIIKHQTRRTNRQTQRNIKKLHTSPIIITTEQVRTAIKQSRNNNSTGPDNINIRHLKHLGHNAITLLTKIYNISLNTNTIPTIWKTAKIIPIPKPNKDPSIGTSYRPIALLSPIAKTIEKIILPHITSNITLPTHQHGFRTAHSTTTALHKITNIITTGFNQRQPPKRTIAIALDMSKAFDTVHLHTLANKILQTDTPNLIIKYIFNYIRGRKQHSLHNGHTSTNRNTKTGVPQGGVLSPTLFNIYMADLPQPPPNVQTITYADDITILSTHTKPDRAQQQVQHYLHEIHTWTQQNQLTLNADKTTTTLFTPDPAEYNKKLTLQINNTTLPTVKEPKILGLTLDPKLNFSRHIQNTTDRAKKGTNILKTLTTTHWGKTKETLITTYKATVQPTIEYANTIWSPLTSNTNINKLQITQNTSLRTATGCTRDTNIQHLHQETKILPLHEHLKLHASQLRQKAQLPTHPLHSLTQEQPPPRLMKPTVFNNNNYTHNLDTPPDYTTPDTIKENMKKIHTHIVNTYIQETNNNKILNDKPPDIDNTEQTLPRTTRRTLSQLRTNKSPFLKSYLHHIDPSTHTSPGCPLCSSINHDARHLFECPSVTTTLVPADLWLNPVAVAELLAQWTREMEAGGQAPA